MIHKKSAIQLREDFVKGKISAVEITTFFLKRIHEFNPKLNAYLKVFDELAFKQAESLDKKRELGKPLGKLAGVPIAIKDNILIQDELCTCASKMLANYRAPYHATVIQLLASEDAIFIGKTNMDEFAMGGSGVHSGFGPTKNPWDPLLSPGGSSSGSAAALSAGLCTVALGTDTGGSIRQPAAMTGITGFKPTYGRVSRWGLVSFGSSLDQIGPFTHSVRDAALLMEIIGKHCPHDSTSLSNPASNYLEQIEKSIEGATVGVPWKFLEELEGEAKKNFDHGLEILRSLGVKIIDVDLSILDYGIAIYYILATGEASTNLARYDGVRYGYRDKEAKTLDEVYKFSRSKGFGWEVKNRILLGTAVLSAGGYEEYYAKAQKVRTVLISKIREAFSSCDMIAIPTTPGTAFPLDGMDDPLKEYLQDLYTVGANLAGLPAISIPSGLSHEGKPFGFQFMGPQTKDGEVLRFAHAFQSRIKPVFPPDYFGVKS